MKVRKKSVKGNMTVEAAIIMQIVLVTIVMLIYTEFAVYNRGIVSSQVSQIGNQVNEAFKYNIQNDGMLRDIQGMNLFWRTSGDFSKEETALERTYLNAVKEKTIGKVSHYVQVTIKNGYFQITAKCNMLIPFRQVKQLVQRLQNIEVSLKIRLIDESEYIRREESNGE